MLAWLFDLVPWFDKHILTKPHRNWSEKDDYGWIVQDGNKIRTKAHHRSCHADIESFEVVGKDLHHKIIDLFRKLNINSKWNECVTSQNNVAYLWTPKLIIVWEFGIAYTKSIQGTVNSTTKTIRFNLKLVVDDMLVNMAKETRKLVKIQNTSSIQYPQIVIISHPYVTLCLECDTRERCQLLIRHREIREVASSVALHL